MISDSFLKRMKEKMVELSCPPIFVMLDYNPEQTVLLSINPDPQILSHKR
jgi:hypothetical protein